MPPVPPVRSRYTTVAIWLHWTIAALVLSNVVLGLVHDSVSREASRQMMWWHEFFGLTIMILTVARLGWRLGHPAPALPDHMPAWERLAARASHWAFYILTLALPLTGWAMLSASLRNRTIPFYGVAFPKLAALTDMAAPARKAATHQFGGLHVDLAWIAIALIVLHVLAALKHQLWNRDTVLHHMAPVVRPGLDARLDADAAVPGRDA